MHGAFDGKDFRHEAIGPVRKLGALTRSCLRHGSKRDERILFAMASSVSVILNALRLRSARI